VIAAAPELDAPYIPFVYGRRQGKPLRAGHQRLMETLLPRLSIPDPTAGPLDLSALFSGREAHELEIGFGGGEHLAWQAARRPERGFIGAEPFVNGVARLLAHIDEAGLDNIRIHFGDARPLIEALPDGAFSRLYVLHPDPWPKKRHFKRRMISPWFFGEAARLLKPDGELRIASDVPDYVRWTLMHARSARAFEWMARAPADWARRPEDWPETRYGAKALREGRPPVYLTFARRG
jgi:tRNA (guanine-N7-)-methyltransferase